MSVFICFSTKLFKNETAETEGALGGPGSGTCNTPVVPDAAEQVQGFP